MASSPFGFGPLPVIRRSVIDPATGNVTQGPQTPPSALDIGGAYLDLLAGRAKDAITAPQRALSGELQVWDRETGHTTDAANEAAGGMAGLAMTGSLPMSRPAGSLGTFAGRLSKTADQGALAKAESMIANGADRQAVWDQTGWFKGADGQMRYEIPDDAAFLEHPMGAPKGYEMLQHGEVQDAYPAMWDRTQQSISPEPTAHGSYDRSYDTILARGPTEDARRSVALHEFQHAIQGQEGFAQGGNPKNHSIAEWQASGGAVSPDDTAFMAWQNDQYRRQAGEVEARNVQARRDWTMDQRREIPPWVTQDVPDADQIVTFGRGGPQMSAQGNLPMDEASRLARAQEMGFDTKRPYYHGSPDGSITDVDPTLTKRGIYGTGFYTTRLKEEANKYAGQGGSVYPLYLKKDRVLDIGTPEGQAVFDAASGAGRESLARDYDLIKAPGQTVVLNGNAVRSKFAAFDPAKKDSANLLASMGGLGLLGAAGLLNAEDDNQPDQPPLPAFSLGPLPRKGF
jgi:hypothetical protein